MLPLTVILLYIAIFSFVIYTFKNKKPLKWDEIFKLIPFHQFILRVDADVARIPGPMRVPFLGTKWQRINMQKLHEYYRDLNKTYGDVVLEMSNNVPVISLFNKADIDKVLQYPSPYPFRPPTEIVSYYRQRRPDRYASLGLVNEQGHQWAKLRSKLTPKTLESRRVLSAFCPDLNEICDEFSSVIKLKRDSFDVVQNFDEVMKLMSLEVACCLILGRRMGYLQDQMEHNEEIKELGHAANNIFAIFRDAYYGNGFWKYFPSKIYNEYVENEEKVYNIVMNIIRRTLQDNELMAEDRDNTSILMMVLKAEGLDVRDKISGIIDFLTASQVISHTVIFLLNFLSQNPEVQEKIYQESIHMKDDLTYEDLNQAHYTRAAVHESFRLSPTAFAVARILEQDYNLSGHNVKAGNVVLCQTMLACNKDENFEDASVYKPERWLNENGEMNINQCESSSIVLPFGYGKRTCPGKKYSEMELIMLTLKLVRTYKIEYVSPFEQQFEFVLAPKGPVNIKFSDRF